MFLLLHPAMFLGFQERVCCLGFPMVLMLVQALAPFLLPQLQTYPNSSPFLPPV